VQATEVTVTLKAAISMEEFENNTEAIKGPLRVEMNCFEPLCTLNVTAQPGSVILTVVATDTAPSSAVHVFATQMVAKPLSALTTTLGIPISEAPTVQAPVTYSVVVVRPVPSPPPPPPPQSPPSPPPLSPASPLPPPQPLTDSDAALSQKDGGEEGLAIAVALGAAVALVLARVAAWAVRRRRRATQAKSLVSSTSAEADSTEKGEPAGVEPQERPGRPPAVETVPKTDQVVAKV